MIRVLDSAEKLERHSRGKQRVKKIKRILHLVRAAIE
jgi:hypothetical protein